MDVIILAVVEVQFAQISGVTWFRLEIRCDNIWDAAAGGETISNEVGQRNIGRLSQSVKAARLLASFGKSANHQQ